MLRKVNTYALIRVYYYNHTDYTSTNEIHILPFVLTNFVEYA